MDSPPELAVTAAGLKEVQPNLSILDTLGLLLGQTAQLCYAGAPPAQGGSDAAREMRVRERARVSRLQEERGSSALPSGLSCSTTVLGCEPAASWL
jgi:hypothetical protein